jgi:NADH dehydrogenase [ubiquinone] 1 alpha subcomplex assembly factor 7
MSADGPAEPLSAIYRRLIANTGPISLMHYMGEANARYYTSRDPLGAAGRFYHRARDQPDVRRTDRACGWPTSGSAPAAKSRSITSSWDRAGGPLAKDALGAATRYGLVPKIHLVESSVALKDVQLSSVPDAIWHHDLSTVPSPRPAPAGRE